ncbi:unnamed protein product [Leptosia nina]|uniref:Uncharacterized protein n=1 Tax=Leptosia nina TaxID=320188 RepID=A0AAV1K0R5_9NEOP
MQWFLLICFLASIHAYRPYYDRINERNIHDDYLSNNNFSEDEMNAINSYKKTRHFRSSNRNDIFDPRYFENRRFFSWIPKWLRRKEKKPPTYQDLVNDKIYYLHLTQNLTENLGQLTNILDAFTKALKEKSLITSNVRIRRDINNTEVTTTGHMNNTDKVNGASQENGQIDIATEVIKVDSDTHKPVERKKANEFKQDFYEEKNMEDISDSTLTKSEMKQVKGIPKEDFYEDKQFESINGRRSLNRFEKATEDKTNSNHVTEHVYEEKKTIDNIPSGRRSFNSNELKRKLISSINDTVNVIQFKLKSVTNVREIFSDRVLFNIGYISGALTTVRGLVNELQAAVSKNVVVLDEKFILDLYDTITKVNSATARMLDKLNRFVDEATKGLIKVN